jgi:hypothetical protein
MFQRSRRPPLPISKTFALAAAASLGFACATPPPSDLAFVVLAPDVIRPKVLRQEVTGEWCFAQDFITVSLRPPWRARLADVQPAITRAIESVPGANVLTDVRLRTRIEQYFFFQRICSIVIGDAGWVE